MLQILNKMLDLIYPAIQKCTFCENELIDSETQFGLCRDCLDQLHPFSENEIIQSEVTESETTENEIIQNTIKQDAVKTKTYLDLIYGAFLYEGIMKELIYQLKYYGARQLIYPLVELMVWQFPFKFKKISWNGLIPVPMHKMRLNERGFNQAFLLAEGLAFCLNLTCCDLLSRIKNTVPQSQLSMIERKKNLRGVFQLKPDVQVNAGNWLIIDDILTTGSSA
ncbi:MAG: hypothetical protein MI862_27725, partial [Desulfobacterales bacterium]|nr:hypothetical protein [Desulfobacterales bacterium]